MLAEWKAEVGQILPTSPEELYTLQVISMVLFTLAAVAIANYRKKRYRLDGVDFHYIVKNIGAGVTLPVSALLVLYPIFPSVSNLLGILSMYLSIAGMFGIILSAYSLIR